MFSSKTGSTVALALTVACSQLWLAAPARAQDVAPRSTPAHLGIWPMAWDQDTEVNGVSFSLVADRVGRFSGLQLSPGANLTGGASAGLQLTGGLNLAETFTGAQVAAVNLAETADGLQLGVVNVAGESSGLQLGVINVARARARGFTFGVINVAREHEGEAFGLLNFIGNGIHDVALYSTETMASNVAVKLGSRHLYTSWMIGYHPGEAGAPAGHYSFGTRRLGAGLGVGYRFDVGWGRLRFVEVEANAMSIASKMRDFSHSAPLLAATRAVVGIDLARSLTLIAGLSQNVAVSVEGRDLDIGSGALEAVVHSGGTTVRTYPGLLLGLQI